MAEGIILMIVGKIVLHHSNGLRATRALEAAHLAQLGGMGSARRKRGGREFAGGSSCGRCAWWRAE